MKFKYKLFWLTYFIYCPNGIILDSEIKFLLARGIKIEDIRIELIEEKEK